MNIRFVNLLLGSGESKLSQVIAIVRGVKDVGVVQLARFLECSKQLAHDIVDRDECAETIAVVLVNVFGDVVVERWILCNHLVLADTRSVPIRGARRLSGRVVGFVPWCRCRGVVRGVRPDVSEEGRVLFRHVFDPRQRSVANLRCLVCGGCVRQDLHRLTAVCEFDKVLFRVEVVVIARRRHGRHALGTLLAAKVPCLVIGYLAKNPRCVACLLQARENRTLRVKDVLLSIHVHAGTSGSTNVVIVTSGHCFRAAWTADRCVHKVVGEGGSLRHKQLLGLVHGLHRVQQLVLIIS
mmetsp:Transcript_17172/g.40976  ORF Transcript_17172/g.40976 Transcript_17172/m.40976 type:complete len:296 (+) Transcript_17172:621-1508(+)